MSELPNRTDLIRILRNAAGDLEIDQSMGEEVLLETRFEDLGVDSISIMEMNGQIRRDYLQDFDTDAADQMTSLAELLDFIHKGKRGSENAS